MDIDFNFSTRDDCLEQMVPSDLRKLVVERDQAEEQLLKLREEAARLRAENERLSIGNRRYEIARRLDPRQWAAAFELNIKTGKAFDQIIDEIGAFVSPTASRQTAGGTDADERGLR